MSFYIFTPIFFSMIGEVFDYLVSHGRMKEKEARAKFRQVRDVIIYASWNLFTFDGMKIS